MLRPLLAASILSLSLGFARAAAAAEAGPWLPKSQGSRVGLEFDWWPTENSHSLTWDIVGQIQLARVVYLDFDVPWAVWDRRVGIGSRRDATAVFGNPSVGAHWADTLTDRIAAFAGGTLTVSTLGSRDAFRAAEDAELYVTRFVASGNRAYSGLHRFVPDHFFIRGWGGIELRILPVLFYRVDLTPVVAIPITDVGNDTDFYFEVHNEIEARARIGVGGGLHLQGVFFTKDVDRNDAVQTAMEPYFVYEPIRGFWARAGVLVALDEALGFGFERDKVATIRVALGGKW